jgi:hypothetical protein
MILVAGIVLRGHASFNQTGDINAIMTSGVESMVP